MIEGSIAFRVGPDYAGHWLAIETHGLGGGLFVTREAALRYARAETSHRPDAVTIVRGPLILS